MDSYRKPIQIRWADIDANNHLRHSVYYDYGAYLRVQFLADAGADMRYMQEHQIGPIIFREEALFKREVHFNDNISMDLEIVKCSADFSRWTIRHTLVKGDGTVAAILNLVGAWINTAERKLAVPSGLRSKAFDDMPRAADFEWIVKNK